VTGPSPRWGLARVHGRSMLPTLHDGDRLLLDHRAVPTPGRVAVVVLPDGTIAVKRLEHLADDGWWVTRDNPAEGVDSWTLGAPVTDVLAIVRARVWPRPGLVPGV
jgi:phage repressor protein C with HTH and peptisase S24 domain